jgi:hypothetical protein
MAEGGETTELHAKLVLDEGAKEAAEKMGEGFEHLSERVHETQHELMGMAKQALAVAAGFELSHGIESIKEFGHEVIGAAMASEEQIRSLAGLVAMTDKTGMSFEETEAKARDLHENLEGLAIESGQTGQAVGDAFELIASRSQKSADEVLALTDKMATAAKLLPGGIESIATAWRDMETGIIRPRNALVQLMVQTHTVNGTMKQVAHTISEMLQKGESEKVFKLAEQAIDNMAKKAEKAPFTFKQLTTSLEGVREIAFKSFGEPMLAALTPPIEKLRNYFLHNEERIEHWARTVGEKAGVWIENSAASLEHAFEYLQTHADEIESAIKGGASALMAVVNFIIDHKEVLAAAWGANMVAGGVSGIAGMIGGMGGMSLGGAAAAVGPQAAFVAMVASMAMMFDQFSKLVHEWPTDASDAFAKINAMEKAAMEGNVAQVRKWGDEIEALDPDLVGLANRIQELAKSVRDSNATIDASYGTDVSVLETYAAYAPDKVAAEFWGDFGQAMDSAHKTTNERVVAEFLVMHNEGFDKVLDAMRKTKMDITKESAELAAALTSMGHLDMAKKVQEAATRGAGGAHPGPPIYDFRGSQFHIKQDFRDSDPDRIALEFRRDLQKHAVARIQSRMATPFGL